MKANSVQGSPLLAEEVLDLARARLRLVAVLFAGVAGVILLLYLLLSGLGMSPPAHLFHFLAAQVTLLFLSVTMARVAAQALRR